MIVCIYIVIFFIFVKPQANVVTKVFDVSEIQLNLMLQVKRFIGKSLYHIYITFGVGQTARFQNPKRRRKGGGVYIPLPRTAFAKMYCKLRQEVWFTGL